MRSREQAPRPQHEPLDRLRRTTDRRPYNLERFALGEPPLNLQVVRVLESPLPLSLTPDLASSRTQARMITEMLRRSHETTVAIACEAHIDDARAL